jgi:tRNA-guanine transglycosylase
VTRLEFKLEATAGGSRARAARFRTLHNEVLTPTFMPVGTHAAVRAQGREDLLASGAQVLLANTYHLLLQPGVAIFEKFSDIHGFMNWPRSVLTDSGGFQIFSLPGSRVLREEGAEFTSYVDRATVRLSPERSIATQKAIGADIMMVLDQCVPSTVERGIARDAMELTHRWARRSLTARGDSPQALFGIVQGASYDDLRVASAHAISDMPFDGFAIGGLAVGESAARREDCTALVTEHLPEHRPRYLMGVGTTRDLLEAVHRGVDMFDCILPTALAKQGVAFTSVGRRDLRRAAYRGMEGPLDPACGCYTCKTFSIAYLFHLHRVRELVRDDVGHIREKRSGELMHPVGDPAQEARLLYVEQSRLLERLDAGGVQPLVVWDVGLGAAANAMAAIHAVEAVQRGSSGEPRAAMRPLVLASFENDLDALKLALRHPRWFKHLRHAGPRQLLAQNRWSSPKAAIDWLLWRGDFAVCKCDAPLPELIFFDPFSFKTDSALWTLSAFLDLAVLCADKAVELFTYSYSTSVRAAMLAAGFYVARGCGTGPKTETTIALSPRAAATPHGRALLGAEWLEKWRRSEAQAPYGVGRTDEGWREVVSGHPQFR